jgi:superfamily II DNA or RNA helicase
MTLEITVLDPIECRISKKDKDFITPCLTIRAEYWRKGRYKRERFEYDKKLFSRKGPETLFFHTGFLPRIQSHLNEQTVPFKIESEDWYIPPNRNPELPGIDFREDQLLLLDNALSMQRGVIKSPTGSGKTILQLGILSAFDEPALILAHTKDIVIQTKEEAEKFGFKDVQMIFGESKFNGKFSEGLVAATMQSFVKIDPKLYCDRFAIVIVDEGHHISSFSGTYAKILGNLLAPIRLAFTATLPVIAEAKMALEGLIGPVIGELTMTEAMKKGILAVPKIKILRVPFSHEIRELKGFNNVYTAGVEENEARNQIIVDKAIEHANKDEVSLIFVNKIEHGNTLAFMFESAGRKVPFVNGSTPGVERANIKKSMIVKRRKIAIATTVWKEGINIPSINAIFMGGGGKSELKVLQDIGRGLRSLDGKRSVSIYDFFDNSHPFLVDHFGERFLTYLEMGWV